MTPLSKTKRLAYLFTLIALFFIFVPIILFYSVGYRLSEDWELVKTGGVYIFTNQTDARLFVDGEFVEKAGILKRGFFVQDLTPGVHDIIVRKDDFQEWHKTLIVAPQRVTEARAFIFPNKVLLTPIAPYIVAGVTSDTLQSGGIAAVNPEYEEALELFATSTTPTSVTLVGLATSTRERLEFPKEDSGIRIWSEDSAVYAQWVGSESEAPYYFCDDNACDRIIQITKQPAQHFDFYPRDGEYVLLTRADGVYISEIDDRSVQNVQQIYPVEGADFRVRGNDVLIQNGAAIFEADI